MASLRLQTEDGRVGAADASALERLLADGRFFWLDMFAPGPEEYRLLREVFDFTRWPWRTRSASANARRSTPTTTWPWS